MIEFQKGIYDQLISARAITDNDHTAATGNLDCRGADYATIVLNMSVEPDPAAVFTTSLLESDDTVATNFVTITPDVVPVLTAAAIRVWHVDMRDRKRFLRLNVQTGTSADTEETMTVAAIGILSRNQTAPASTTGMTSSTSDTALVLPA